MTEKEIKQYIKKEALFQNLQNQKAKVQIALEILITTGLIKLNEIMLIKDLAEKRAMEIIKKEKLNV